MSTISRSSRTRISRSSRTRREGLTTGGPEVVSDVAECESKVRAALERNHVLGSGLKVGKAFRVQTVEGSPWYEVTCVGSTSAEVEWRDYGLDRYMDEMLVGGGVFPVSLVERLVYQHDTLEELFGARN